MSNTEQLRVLLILLAMLCVPATGCTGNIDSPPGEETADVWEGDTGSLSPDVMYLPNSLTSPDDVGKADQPTLELTATETERYLGTLAEMLVGRLLNSEELARIDALSHHAIVPILEGWTADLQFARRARDMMERKLRTSGQTEEIDFEAPGRIVEYVVANNLPWGEIITASYCIGEDGSQVNCDSGAPYAAGVLTTRAWLASNASRFNLGRASRLMKVFACEAYPINDTLQPYVPKEELIPMFRALSAAEQTVEEAKGAFGNGDACYQCHGQFSAHAQVFVKFDQTGVWREEATGQQDPEGELGRSFDGLMTSHMDDPDDAAAERSQVFGVHVENLAGAATVIAQSDEFLPCSTRNLLEYTFGFSESEAEEIDRDLLIEVSDEAMMSSDTPTLADLTVATFSNPRVIRAVLESSPPTAQE